MSFFKTIHILIMLNFKQEKNNFIYNVMLNEIIINRYNLLRNLSFIKEQNPNSLICAMVKANAYGVGMKEIVKILDEKVDFFGVASAQEAVRLRKYTKNKILIFSPIERKSVIDNDFSYTCCDIEDVEFLINKKVVANIHLKVNTGMNRYGFNSIKEFKRALSLIKKSKLKLEGVFTHFATSDDYVDKQMKIFNKYILVTKRAGFKPIIHADNSSVCELKNHHLDMVRIGFNLYNRFSDNFLPVAEIKSIITQIQEIKKGELVGYDRRFVAKKKMRVAIIPIGYADGLSLAYLGMKLNIKGQECEILNICMDCFMLDVTKLDVKKGDKIGILNNLNPISKFAKYRHTSEYEIMCNFSSVRATRRIIN